MKKKILYIDLFNIKIPLNKYYPELEFHILASVRKKYGISNSLFSMSGNVIFTDYRSVRELAIKMNVRAGQLNAMGLIDEIYHYVLRIYEETANQGVFERAKSYLIQKLNENNIYNTIKIFTSLFPPLDVYTGRFNIEDYLYSKSAGRPNIEIAIEEIILLYFANTNPAFSQFKELFDDRELRAQTEYQKFIVELENFFRTQKPFGPENQYIFDLLRAPILASPNSLEGQLEYIKTKWRMLLSEKYLTRLLSAGDLIKEDLRLIFKGDLTATPPVPKYTKEGLKSVGFLDLEKFTNDMDWMPNVVLIAKNIYVWLDQLSKKYNRKMTRLDEIPDEELDQIRKWNINAIWLIGVWERSPASQKIKQWSGNPEAVSSAYSVYDYTIASELGGESAFENLKHRSIQRGIRLAGDMVPNHMGICSKWVIEKPDYFIQTNISPFPNYSFTCENLSQHPDIEIRIEDGYWNRTDAAVVFQRIDRRHGDVRYIYHGNDGTHMPWNDTAQLDFLKAEVREAVIQTIFHVARKFSIIRFDAAMTLTKQHFQRLWYPQPGTGGDIPSRSDFSMSKEEFNKYLPKEFWREVVDRINQEMPDTLLLAEAFWLLEGYFVRTLGMHRVYNSAFMHMFMKEENSKYRELIRNTMHYNPEILKRYVNFMSNPDEQTTIAQFGKGDKYFGVAMMMVTLPGLPMFAHGQIEGYTEKYGMEYRRAYYDEQPDYYLIHRHEQEIFPIIEHRYLFSQVQNFELYDFKDNSGCLIENVFAFSNRIGNEKAIVVYNNYFSETSGWIKNTVGRNIGTTDNPHIIYKTLAEALDIKNDDNIFYTYRDHITKLEYLKSGKDFHEYGLYIELKAYQYNLFWNFKEIYDTKGEYRKLSNRLKGLGVYDINEELYLDSIETVHVGLSELMDKEFIEMFTNYIHGGKNKNYEILALIEKKYKALLQEMKLKTGFDFDEKKILNRARKNILTIRRLIINNWKIDGIKCSHININSRANELTMYLWVLLNHINEENTQDIFSRLRIEKALKNILYMYNNYQLNSEELIELIKLIITSKLYSIEDTIANLKYFESENVMRYIKLHEYEKQRYFNKEKFEELIYWQQTIASIEILCKRFNKSNIEKVKNIKTYTDKLINISRKSGYVYDIFQKELANF